jgi:hypothetical protein
MTDIIKFFGVAGIIIGSILILIGLLSFGIFFILVGAGLNALLGGALLIAFARAVELLESINDKVSPVNVATSITPQANSQPTIPRPVFDAQKWRVLSEFDPDLIRINATLRPYGEKYVNLFATEYLILNDKQYIPNILEKVLETAHQDAAEAKAAEERWANWSHDPQHVQKFAKEMFYFLVSRPYGNVAILKTGAVILQRPDGQISNYRSASDLRDATNDRESWFDMPDDAKINFVRAIQSHIPT